jgi:two-component system, NtrC family, response regulator AtoC
VNLRRLLIVEDDRFFSELVRGELAGGDLEVVVEHTLAGARRQDVTRFDVVLLDNSLPDGDGLLLVPDILRVNDGAKIILVTAFPSFDNAVLALKNGVYDYFCKPVDLEELRLAVARSLRTADLERVEQVERYRTTVERGDTVLIGNAAAFAEIERMMRRAALFDAPVLITGETGTGKSLVAKSIHFRGTDPNRTFLSVNCSALPESLVEAELFGVEKGAFTGAVATRKGLLEIADGGTLFLDEIAEMPVGLQAKLLGVLEDRTVRRLGSGVPRTVTTRILAATNADPEQAVAAGRFRGDLYYRLNVIRIHLPPLRERIEDVPALCAFFLQKLAPGRQVELAPGEERQLMAYPWPGNIRELKNIIERSLILEEGARLSPSHLLHGAPLALSPAAAAPPPAAAAPAPAASASAAGADGLETLAELERRQITRAFQEFGGSHKKTADALGISLSTLRRKLQSYGLLDSN